MSGSEIAASPATAGHDIRSVLAGGIAVLIGVAAIAEGRRYAVGTLLRMGPGYFPIVLGALLVALGAALAIFGFARRAQPAHREFLWRPVVMIPAGIAGFAHAITHLGLAPATFVLVVVSSLSEKHVSPEPVLLLATGMTLGVWVIFSVILGLPYPLFVW